MYRSISEYVRNCGPESDGRYISTDRMKDADRRILYLLLEYRSDGNPDHLSRAKFLIDEIEKGDE